MPSMYENYESMQEAKPEHKILDVLASLGISYELFSKTSPKIARKIGDAILKAVASELHPDRGNELVEFNGINIQDINLVRGMLANADIDIAREASASNYENFDLQRQKNELDHVKESLTNQRSIGSVLLSELTKTKETLSIQSDSRDVTMLMVREETTVNHKKNGDADYASVFVQRVVRFNDKGEVASVSDCYEDKASQKLLLTKKIDELAASDIIEKFSDLDPVELESINFMIFDESLYSAPPFKPFKPTGINFMPQKKAEEALLESVTGLPLKLAFAKPKNAGDSKEKVVTPVFKFSEAEEARDGYKLIGSRFVGYYYFERTNESGPDNDSIHKRAVKTLEAAESRHKISTLSSSEMNNFLSRASRITTDINNNDVDNLRHSGYVVCVFSKKNSNTGAVEYYIAPEAYKVLSPYEQGN